MPRQTPLPTAPPRGRLVIPMGIAHAVEDALLGFCGPDGRHEGIVYLAGFKIEDIAYAMLPLVPHCDHGRQHVFVDERTAGRLTKAARRHGLVLVAQVHSHPGRSTVHSDGDDRLILMPYEGYFSVIIGEYGSAGIGESTGVHQYQDRRWVGIKDPFGSALVVLPRAMGVGDGIGGSVLSPAR